MFPFNVYAELPDTFSKQSNIELINELKSILYKLKKEEIETVNFNDCLERLDDLIEDLENE